VATIAALTEEGRLLPPDWVRADGAAVSASASPNGDPPEVQYGPDAQRVVVWLASSCEPSARRLAAAWWPVLSGGETSRALALRTDGQVVNGTPTRRLASTPRTRPTTAPPGWRSAGRSSRPTCSAAAGRRHAPADTLPSVLPFAHRAVYGATASSGDWP
jgi:hypothetical protein